MQDQIKHTVEVNDALSPNFRTLLAIWQNPEALKTPMTLAGMAAQHIDWTNSFSWTGVFPTLALATPPSIKAFVNKSEYQSLVFSKELCQLLTPEIKFKSEIERIKKMTALLQHSTEKLHLALLREHGLSEPVSASEKKEHVKEEKEQEADLTLTFAESAISEIATQHRSTLKPAATQLTTALDGYLTAATQRISLGTLARRINRWYEGASILTMEHLLKSTVSTPRPTTEMTFASSASTVSSTSATSSQTFSQSLPQTLLGTSAKSAETSSTTSTVTSSTSAKKTT